MDRCFYDIPTQVMFVEPKYVKDGNEDNGPAWYAGIAYRDEVICACCGGAFAIEDVIASAEEYGLAHGIYHYGEWMDLTNSIIVDILPMGLVETPEDIVEAVEGITSRKSRSGPCIF